MQFVLFLAVAICCTVFGTHQADVDPIPDPWKNALMARYILRHSDWVALGTLSTQEQIKGYPFASALSVSEGTPEKSTGNPYMYITHQDYPAEDVEVDNRVSVMATLAEGDYCISKTWDQEDPRCPRVCITGRLINVANNTEEFKFALEALYYRHPAMKAWPVDHLFKVTKVAVDQVQIFDAFGGPKNINASDYFSPSISKILTSGKEIDWKSI